MRLDPPYITNSISDTAGVRAQIPVGQGFSATEGEVIRACVIACRDGEASLKAEDGTVFRARLDDGVALRPGTDALLVVTERRDGVIYMSLAQPEAADAAAQQQPDPVSAAIMNRLASMGFEASAENVRAVMELLSAYPDTPLNEAVFASANSLPAEPGVMRAVHSLLSGEADTSSMLDALAKLASAAAEAPEPQTRPAPVPGQPAPAPSQPTSVPEQPDSILSRPVTEEPPPEPAHTVPEALLKTVRQDAGNSNINGNDYDEALPRQAREAQAPQQARTPEAPLDFTRWLSRLAGADNAQTARLPARLDVSALSQAPVFRDVNARVLSVVADSLNSIARSMPKLGSDSELFESIVRFAGELVVRRSDAAPEAAETLKAIRQELYVKLAYFRDAVAASESPAKTAVLEQVNKLMDHTRLLSSLEQFAYVQLPIQLGGERGNAELYIYKKDKGGSKRLDPEDVRILLALDLEHMGHTETFIEVRGREITLRFEVETEEAAACFIQNTTKLHKLLDGSGYKFTNSTVTTKKQHSTVETALISLISYERSKGGGLDCMI